MRFTNPLAGRGKAVAVGAAAVVVAAGVTTGTAVAAKQITSSAIKDGTIQTRDLTKNNFARFTSTETVVNAATPVNPAASNKQVVQVPAGPTPVPLTQIVLNKGTWKLSGQAQFWHLGNNSNAADVDYGQVTVGGLENSLGTFFTADIPASGANAGQTSFDGTVTITANNTPVVIYGTISGANAGQAGASVTATQYKYVKLFRNGS